MCSSKPSRHVWKTLKPCESFSGIQFPAMFNPGQRSYLDFSLGGIDSTSVTFVLLILACNVHVISPVCKHAGSKHAQKCTRHRQDSVCALVLSVWHYIKLCPAWNSDTGLPTLYISLCFLPVWCQKTARDCQHQNENIFLVKNTRLHAIF